MTGTYSALVAVDQDRVVLLVVDHLQNRRYGLNWNRLLLGTLQKEDMVLNTIGLHEGCKGLRALFVNKRARWKLAISGWQV